MIAKQANKRFVHARRGLKFFIIGEGLLFLTSYTLWSECNRSQASRKYFHDRIYLRWIVEFYYKIGETRGTSIVREFDRVTWEAEDKLTKFEAKSE